MNEDKIRAELFNEFAATHLRHDAAHHQLAKDVWNTAWKTALATRPDVFSEEKFQEAITKAYGLLWDAPTHYDRRIIAARKILLSVMTKDMQREGITFARQEFNQ